MIYIETLQCFRSWYNYNYDKVDIPCPTLSEITILELEFTISNIVDVDIWGNYLKSKPNDVTTISFILETLEYVQMEDFKYLSWIGNSLEGTVRQSDLRPETEKIIFYS